MDMKELIESRPRLRGIQDTETLENMARKLNVWAEYISDLEAFCDEVMGELGKAVELIDELEWSRKERGEIDGV